jgi:hypothetical protein
VNIWSVRNPRMNNIKLERYLSTNTQSIIQPYIKDIIKNAERKIPMFLEISDIASKFFSGFAIRRRRSLR